MANSTNLSVIIGAIDRLSGPMNRINQTIERVRAPVDRVNRSLGRLGRAAGMRQFNRNLNRAARNARNAARAVGGIGKTAAGLSTAAVAGVTALAKSFANSGDNVAKSAQRLGIGVEALQRYRYAADRSGVSSDTFDMALQRMGRRAAEAARGTGAAKDAFETMGISLRDSAGNMRSVESLLLESFDALDRVKDPLTRNALAMKLFDSEGVKLVQMANGGAKAVKALGKEADALGLVISEKAARESEAFNDALTNLSGSMTGLRNRLGEKLIPVLTPLIQKFTKLAVDLGPALSRWATNFATNLPGHLDTLKQLFGELLQKLEPIVDVAKFISDNFGLMNTALAVVGTLMAGSLITAITSITSAFWLLGAAMLGTPVGWITAGIAGLVAVGVTLYKNWDVVKEKLKSFSEMVMKYNPFAILVKSVQKLIEKFKGFNFLDKLKDKLRNLLPHWAIDLLGLDAKAAPLQAPIPGGNNDVSGTVKIQVEGAARVTGIDSENRNVGLQVDTGRAMPASGQTPIKRSRSLRQG